MTNPTGKILNIGTYMFLKEQSDQDLHCLPFCLYHLEVRVLLNCKIKLFYVKDNHSS